MVTTRLVVVTYGADWAAYPGRRGSCLRLSAGLRLFRQPACGLEAHQQAPGVAGRPLPV